MIGIGAILAVRAAMRRFLRQLDTAAMSRRTKQAVTALGVGGGVARGVVFAAPGVFVLVAAVRFDPDEPKGVDATLRSFAQTPAGPWLLVAVAIRLIHCGVLASARWRRAVNAAPNHCQSRFGSVCGGDSRARVVRPPARGGVRSRR